MPSPVVEKLGQIITKQTLTSPDKARALLMAAYSWVNLSGKFPRPHNVRAATERVNGGIAGTIVDSFHRPDNAVMVNIFMPCEIIHAMGLVPMFPEGLSAYIANTACEEVFVETSEAHDIAETFCSYHKLMMGVAETGVMPRPLMITNTTLACDANQLSFPRLAKFYDVPHHVIDVPSTVSEESVAYVADSCVNWQRCSKTFRIVILTRPHCVRPWSVRARRSRPTSARSRCAVRSAWIPR